ncbi:MAG: hypothetical protein M3367_00820 [Acidobacteriota bacterium]|nr:hypothetical protein [Acidobacteriota bacterium]
MCGAVVSLCACGVDSANSKSSVPSVSAQTVSPDNVNKSVESKNFDSSILYFDEIYSNDDTLAYGAYQVEKRSKMLWLKDAEVNAEVTYFVLKRDGKTAATFEGIHYPLGNDARFGLFPVLGQKTKQLIIEEEAHRAWHHWVVSLSPNAKVIYDSGDYPVGHSLRAIDIDKDGDYELIQSLHSFWFFARLSNVDSPFIDIIFVYNPTLQKYIPANPQFQEFALRNIEDDIRKAKEIKSNSSLPGQEGGKLGAVLEVVLSYLYAGKKQEAWAFYESEYNLPDKKEMKVTIQEALSKEAVYRAVNK